MSSINLSAELESEYWGILHFEANLWGLYCYLDLETEIDFSFFADCVCFPDKMPESFQEEIYHRLRNRLKDPSYDKYSGIPIPNEYVLYEAIVKEVMYLKIMKQETNIEQLPYLFSLPPHSFFAFITQLVERGYLSSMTVVQITAFYFDKRSELEGDSLENNDEKDSEF
ncbi:hypothetical protein [Niallia taxi]|uniref:hypothetical protein n=1 Tax=Niallia taxi TaxID=2499688 RepID=UPI0015F3FF3A|nr:hypothetical protein [Niallia taxi]